MSAAGHNLALGGGMEWPLRLVAAPARQFPNSTFTETPTARKREGWSQALICPEDTARFGITSVLMREDRADAVMLATE
jgi:hypothetical protein